MLGLRSSEQNSRAVARSDGLTFEVSEAAKCCGFGCEILARWVDEMLTLKRTWETENPPDRKFN